MCELPSHEKQTSVYTACATIGQQTELSYDKEQCYVSEKEPMHDTQCSEIACEQQRSLQFEQSAEKQTVANDNK